MVKIKLVPIAVLFSIITIFADTNTVTAQNVVTTIDLNPNSDISVLPFAVEVNHIDNRLYIAAFNINSEKNEIIVIDSLTNDIIDTIRFSGRNLFSQIKINPVSKRIYFANLEGNVSSDNKIHVINGTTNKIITSIKIEDGIEGIAVNSSTNRIYVVNNKKVTVTVIDGQTNEIIDVIKLQKDVDLLFRSEGIKVNPFTNIIYVLKDSTIKKPNPSYLENTLGLPRKSLRSIDEEIKEKEIIVIDGTTNRIIKRVKLDFNALTDVIDPHITNAIFSHGLFSDTSYILSSVYKIEIIPVTNRIYIYLSIKNFDGDGFNSILVTDVPRGKSQKNFEYEQIGCFRVSIVATTNIFKHLPTRRR